MDKILFKELNNTEMQYKMIYSWCLNPHVYKYFEQRKLSYEEIVNKYKKRLRMNAHIKTLIINYNDIDIGIIQYSKLLMDDIRRFNLFEYNQIYQLDIFIGDDNYLHKGIGKLALEKLINNLNNMGINNYVAFIEEDNINSIKCFNKLGFKLYKKFKQNNSIKYKTNYCLLLKNK